MTVDQNRSIIQGSNELALARMHASRSVNSDKQSSEQSPHGIRSPPPPLPKPLTTSQPLAHAFRPSKVGGAFFD